MGADLYDPMGETGPTDLVVACTSNSYAHPAVGGRTALVDSTAPAVLSGTAVLHQTDTGSVVSAVGMMYRTKTGMRRQDTVDKTQLVVSAWLEEGPVQESMVESIAEQAMLWAGAAHQPPCAMTETT